MNPPTKFVYSSKGAAERRRVENVDACVRMCGCVYAFVSLGGLERGDRQYHKYVASKQAGTQYSLVAFIVISSPVEWTVDPYLS